MMREQFPGAQSAGAASTACVPMQPPSANHRLCNRGCVPDCYILRHELLHGGRTGRVQLRKSDCIGHELLNALRACAQLLAPSVGGMMDGSRLPAGPIDSDCVQVLRWKAHLIRW